jgi:single-strand DNA-binding protein
LVPLCQVASGRCISPGLIGRKVYAEGRLQTRSYPDQDGIERYATEIVLEELVMLDSMPKEVRQTMELQDALADASNGAPAQQV